MELDEYRAIKEVPRSIADYQQFRKEALILKSLRHPSIPIVYDLEETADYFYMIEEWIDGISLYQMISDLGHLSSAAAVSFGLQICRLVHFLHSAKPNPILYLDLHPKNLIVSEQNIVKLIDFDHAVHLSEAEHLIKRYGTVGFAAPEQHTGGVLDEKTDIYAIGAVLFYMLTGEFPNGSRLHPGSAVSFPLVRLINKCLSQEPNRRFASVGELSRALEQIQRFVDTGKQGELRGKSTSSLTIAVAGSTHGVGTTHISLGLTAWLCRQGQSALYEECHRTDAMRPYVDFEHAEPDACGVYLIRGVPVRPWYGEAVKLENPEYTVRICDYGPVDETFPQKAADQYLLVCGSKPWEWKTGRDALRIVENMQDVTVLYNHYGADFHQLPVPGNKVSCFLMPCVSDPWAAGITAEKVFEAIWLLWTGQKKERWVRRWHGGGRIPRFLSDGHKNR